MRQCDPTTPASSLEQSAIETRSETTVSAFRKLREALLANPFKDGRDNVPAAVVAVSGLFIGSYGAASNLEALAETKITHILCVAPSLPLKFPETFTYLQLKVADRPSVTISAFFDRAFDFIDSALSLRGKVLVHCFMGRSRSATIILAFLITRHGYTLSDALCALRRTRPQAQPNSGFYRELIALEAKQKQLREQGA
ncbi:unnamed protein product [Hyaloperonospora brassicae]|uniref:Protein-tyrosine-phosphatase n=1 Tax=Hyaloperonospora brassicae TaxID=162125 RepID=A0AAV0TAH6_HYABA|nr:unnamed protein product [Hyaloperonospora brassicae]